MPESPAQMANRLNRQAANANRAVSVSGAGQSVDLGEQEAMLFAKLYGWGVVPKFDDPNRDTFREKLELWRKRGKPVPKQPAPAPTPLPSPTPGTLGDILGGGQ